MNYLEAATLKNSVFGCVISCTLVLKYQCPITFSLHFPSFSSLWARQPLCAFSTSQTEQPHVLRAQKGKPNNTLRNRWIISSKMPQPLGLQRVSETRDSEHVGLAAGKSHPLRPKLRVAQVRREMSVCAFWGTQQSRGAGDGEQGESQPIFMVEEDLCSFWLHLTILFLSPEHLIFSFVWCPYTFSQYCFFPFSCFKPNNGRHWF